METEKLVLFLRFSSPVYRKTQIVQKDLLSGPKGLKRYVDGCSVLKVKSVT